MMSRPSSSYLSLIVVVKQLSTLVKMDYNRLLNKSDYHHLWSESEMSLSGSVLFESFCPAGGAAIEVCGSFQRLCLGDGSPSLGTCL